MSEVALASINSFAYIPGKANSSVQPDENAIVLVPLQILQELLAEVQSLRAEVQDLQCRQDALEAQISSREAQQPSQTEIMPLKPILEAHQERLRDLSVRMVGMEMAQDELETRFFAKVSAPPTPRGEKTLARIAKIEEILRERGPTTFKGIERMLDISPREMLRITKKLDLRHYEISRRPGDARQKVIRLRVQIRS